MASTSSKNNSTFVKVVIQKDYWRSYRTAPSKRRSPFVEQMILEHYHDFNLPGCNVSIQEDEKGLLKLADNSNSDSTVLVKNLSDLLAAFLVAQDYVYQSSEFGFNPKTGYPVFVLKSDRTTPENQAAVNWFYEFAEQILGYIIPCHQKMVAASERDAHCDLTVSLSLLWDYAVSVDTMLFST